MPLTRKQDDLRATIRGLLDRYPVDHDAGDGAEGRLWHRLCVEFGAGGLRYRSDSAAAPARSRCTSYAAAQAAEHGAPDTGLRAAAAKVYCFEALQQVSAEMIQLH